MPLFSRWRRGRLNRQNSVWQAVESEGTVASLTLPLN